MKNDLMHMLGSFGCRTDYKILKGIIDHFHFTGNTCYFCFDLLTDKCKYFCPSITGILGYDHRKYQNKGFLFFKKLIHPTDFLYFIDEVITLVSLNEEKSFGTFTGNPSGLIIRIRHRNGEWQKSKVNLVLLKETDHKNMKILLGFLSSIPHPPENSYHSPSLITEREREVFRYLSEGDSAKMIAVKMHISESTVVTHRKNLIGKLGVKNSAELIKRGYDLNILNSPPVFG